MARMGTDRIDKILRQILPLYFACIFLLTVGNGGVAYITHDIWMIGDWLINYQGGFVRRGLAGELILQLAKATEINPGIIVYSLQLSLYATFFLLSYVLLKKQNTILPYALLLCSPCIYTFHLYDPAGGFRKEIIYFVVLSFLVWSAMWVDQRRYKQAFYSVILAYPFAILTHEMLIVFMPYLLASHLLAVKVKKRDVFIIALLLVPSFIALVASAYHRGDAGHAESIYESLSVAGYVVKEGGAILWLENGIQEGWTLVKTNIFDTNNYIYSLLVLALASVAYFPVRKNIETLKDNKLSLAMVMVSMAGTLPLLFVAVDWGRFIYIHLVSLFLLSLAYVPNKLSNEKKQMIKSGSPGVGVKAGYAILLLAYIFIWHIPHHDSENLFVDVGHHYRMLSLPYVVLLSSKQAN